MDVTDLLDSQLTGTDLNLNQPVTPTQDSSSGPHEGDSGNIHTNIKHPVAPQTPNPPPTTSTSSPSASVVHGVLPDTPLIGPKPSTGESNTTEHYKNNSANIENSSKEDHEKSKKITPVNLGVFIAVFVLVTVFVLILIGVLKEHKYLRFKGAVCLRRGRVAVATNGKVNGTATKKKKKPNPKKTLHSLLGPSQLGFSRLKTYDSDSEEEEFPVFNRV